MPNPYALAPTVDRESRIEAGTSAPRRLSPLTALIAGALVAWLVGGPAAAALVSAF